MKRPLTTVALLYSGGLLLGNHFHLPLLWLFAAAFALLLAALFSSRNFYLWPIVVLAGWINLQSRMEIISPRDLRLKFGNNAAFVTVRGTLREAPGVRVFQNGEEESWRTLAQISVTEIRTNGQWQPVSGKLMTSTDGRLDARFSAGQKIEITGVIQPPRVRVAEGEFDYRAYLERQEIFYQLTVASTNDWKTIGDFRPLPLSQKFFSWAQKVLQRGLPVEDEPLRLVWAMTLGWKTALTDEVSAPFMRSGTMHIFAISGLHIALIAGILVALLRVMQLPRGWCGAIVIPLIWFYTAATGWQPSAIRSTIMMTIIIAGWSLRRPSDLLNSLAASAFIILVWDPQQLFQASFQLSFFVVLSIALLMPVFQKYRESILRPDPLLPLELRSEWRQRLDFPLSFTTGALATSLAAFLGALPLVAYYFHLVTPVSLFANFVIVPLSSLALMANLGSLFCGNWFPFAGELFNHAGWLFMKWMVAASHWFASVRGGFFNVSAPSIFVCAIYYTLLFTLLNGWLRLPRKRLVPILLASFAMLACVWQWRAESQTAKISILPLSGGQAVFVDCAGRSNDLLVDCGNDNAVQFTLEPFLRGQGVNSIGNLVLTHGDSRHVGGTTRIEQNFRVRKIFTSAPPSKSPIYREIVSQLRNQLERWKPLVRGDSVGAWTVLHPEISDEFQQADDKSLVLRGTILGKTILLLSDLGRPGQNALLKRHDNLRADIVVAGLPARGEPLADALLEKIQPQLIIITDSEFPATERASRKLRERLSKQKVPVIYCRDAGAVALKFDASGFSVLPRE